MRPAQSGQYFPRLDLGIKAAPQTVHLLGGNPGDILTRAARIDAVTPSLVQDTFRKYFPLDRYTVVTLLPETQP